jgi:mono/diheme cytochrome c family protein
MKQLLLFISLVSVVAFMTKCTDADKPTTEETPAMTHEDTVQRGKYLVETMGCHDCHSPKRMGANGQPELIADRILSGYNSANPLQIPTTTGIDRGWVILNPDFTAFAGPWGVSFSANLTSDETGIGNWTLEQFKRAIKEGKYKGLESGRPLLPPMPWPNLVHISDEDAAAMFAYLKSTNPVKNVPPVPIPPDSLMRMSQPQ